MPCHSPSLPLSNEDRIEVFKLATRSLVHRYSDQSKSGMTDEELKRALEQSLGIFGGSCGPGRFSITHTGAGLRIWGGWHIVNHVQEKPLFSGDKTLALAREVYCIPNPDNKQMALL